MTGAVERRKPCLPGSEKETWLEIGDSEPRLPSMRVKPRRGLSGRVTHDPKRTKEPCVGWERKDDESRVPRTKNLAIGKGPPPWPLATDHNVFRRGRPASCADPVIAPAVNRVPVDSVQFTLHQCYKTTVWAI